MNRNLIVIAAVCGVIFTLFIGGGCSRGKEEDKGATLLHELATFLEPSIKESIEEELKHTDIEVRDKNGATPLHYAANSRNPIAMEVLMNHGADINARTHGGVTPLHITCSSKIDRCERCTGILLQAGADVKMRCDAGTTALHWASLCSRPEVVAMLLDFGADINAKDNEGKTPLYWSSGSSGRLDGMVTAQARSENMKILLANGADISARDNSGETAFHNAEHPEIIETLLQAGMDPDIKSSNGSTLLHLMAKDGNLQSVQLLLESGANPKALNNAGQTPLDIAKTAPREEWKKHDEVVKLLQQAVK